MASMMAPVSPILATRSGWPPSVTAPPLRAKWFCLPARSKSPGTRSQLPLSWRALNQAAHSHEFSPLRSLVSQVTQK